MPDSVLRRTVLRIVLQNDPEATAKFQVVGEAYMCLTQEDYFDDGALIGSGLWKSVLSFFFHILLVLNAALLGSVV